MLSYSKKYWGEKAEFKGETSEKLPLKLKNI